MKSCIALISFILLAVSCNLSKDTKEVKSNNKYSLEIPSSLVENKSLNKAASLSYNNLLEELYIIVLDESKEEMNQVMLVNRLNETYGNGLIGYAELLSQNLMKSVKNGKISKLKKAKINSLNAYTTEIEGVINGIKIYYLFAFVEGKDSYYQIMSWTLLNKKQEHQQKIKSMILSFKELGASKSLKLEEKKANDSKKHRSK